MADNTRKLDDAMGGDDVPIGPLGGPEPKTREQLLDEQRNRQEAGDDYQPSRPTETTSRRAGESDEDYQRRTEQERQQRSDVV